MVSLSSNGYYLGRNYQQQVLRSHPVQNDMRWNKQVSNATNKAMKTLNFIKRNFYHTSTGTKEKLYSMLAKPHLNYATAAWDPHTTKNINELSRENPKCCSQIHQRRLWKRHKCHSPQGVAGLGPTPKGEMQS